MPAPRAAGEAYDSIGLLVHETKGGSYAAGTATLVSPCHVLSAYHVAGGGEPVDADTTDIFYLGVGDNGPSFDDFDHFALSSKARAIVWGNYKSPASHRGSPVQGELEVDDGWQDWTLLRLDDCLGEPDRGYGYLRLLSLGTRDLTRSGAMLGASTLGFPVDKDAKELWLDPRCQILGQLYSSGWQHDCITLPGNSGGPVLVKDAKSGEERIVAINVSHIAIEGLSDSQSDNLFLKSDDPTYYEYLSIAVPVSAFADKIARYLPADSGLILDAARLSNERYVKGAEDAAIADLDQALAKTPGAANLLLLRGFWLASKGDIKAALVDWKAAESDKASRPRARYEQARLQLDLGAPDMLAEAQSTFSDLAQEFPDNPELLHFRGLTKARLDDPAGAIADFDAALKTRPESAVIYNERGDAYRAMREYDQALDDYGRAIKLAPDWPEAWRDRGYLQHLRARYAKAERDFERALAIDARDAEAMNGLGLIALSEGDGEGAIAQFNRAIDAAPESSVYLANRGAAAWVEGDLAAALADFDRSIALEPSEPYIWLFEFLALARMDRRAEAAKRLAQYLDTEDAPADWPRALMEYYLGRNSIDALEAALAKAPKDKLEGFRFDRDFYLGEWALVRGDRTSALSRLKAVLDSQLREYLEYDLARADYLALGGTLEE